MVDEKWEFRDQIPSEYLELINWVDAEFIRERLETVAYFPILLTSHKACVNSALLCQNMVAYMVDQYPNRYSMHEQTPV